MTFSKKGMAKKEKVLKTVFTQRLTTKKRDDKIRTANETISTEQIAQDGPKQVLPRNNLKWIASDSGVTSGAKGMSTTK